MAVCNDAAYFRQFVAGLIAEAQARVPALGTPAPLQFDDRAKGPAYAVASEEQRKFIVEVARLSGLVLDPVYTGKALFGLAESIRTEGSRVGHRVLFLHTGGLPGLLAQGAEFEQDL